MQHSYSLSKPSLALILNEYWTSYHSTHTQVNHDEPWPSCHETAAGTIWWPVGAAWPSRRPSEGGSMNFLLQTLQFKSFCPSHARTNSDTQDSTSTDSTALLTNAIGSRECLYMPQSQVCVNKLPPAKSSRNSRRNVLHTRDQLINMCGIHRDKIKNV